MESCALRLGIPTLLEMKTPADGAAICRSLGMQFVELNLNFPGFQPETLRRSHLDRLAASSGIFFTAHFDDNLNVADFNGRVAEAAAETVLDMIALAGETGMPVLNMHLPRGGVYTTPQKKWYFFEAYRQAYLDRMAAFRARCTAAAEGLPVTLCVEHTDGFLPFQQEALALLLESPLFGLTLDVGHNRCAGGVDEPLYRRYTDRLRHLHLHDVQPGGRDHQAFGTGEVDLAACLRFAAAHGCTAVAEVKTLPALEQSAAWLDRQSSRSSTSSI